MLDSTEAESVVEQSAPKPRKRDPEYYRQRRARRYAMRSSPGKVAKEETPVAPEPETVARELEAVAQTEPELQPVVAHDEPHYENGPSALPDYACGAQRIK